MKTSKKITLEVLAGSYMANIGTEKECINTQYFCESVAMEMLNDQQTYVEVTQNTRRTIESICWGAIVKHVNTLVSWYYDGYSATGEHVKSFINNDYSIFNDLYEQMRIEREEYQEELEEQKEEKPKKFGITKKEAIESYKEIWQDWDAYKKLDKCARAEDWNNYVDMLCKEGKITDWQYNNWLNPEFCK